MNYINFNDALVPIMFDYFPVQNKIKKRENTLTRESFFRFLPLATAIHFSRNVLELV